MSTFVGRERELGRLQAFLDAALSSQAQVCFVTGEAGAGKSALVGEFVRRAQEQDPRAIAVVGQCNAQTGAGDAYLPFREVLTTLSGARDDEPAANTLSPTNAVRLKEFVRVAGSTLIDVAPDLIGLFVPGASLLAKAAMAAARHGKLPEKVAEQVGQRNKPSAAAHLDQQQVFEEYASALRAFAQGHPLIVILDDLHWADSASLSLLFHLSRALSASPVLLVGTYRPDDVALGRGGERHPLESILNEIKRYRGDVVIDLGAAQVAEERSFVDALIDAEPNRLDETFHRELYQRTDGHPLFTVETLRNLQERGDLVKDADGRWVQSGPLDWGGLPARVEGVIGERIGRLDNGSRETLNVASVVGADFAAQVVARIQHTSERELVRQLSHELDKRHHLVHEQGESRIGTQFLSLYRFSHALFQQYLYNDLGAGERRLLHGDAAEALEALYAGHTDEIALQLAQHYREACDDEHAAVYLIRAGDAAFAVYANNEAAAHYSLALALGGQSLTVEQLRHVFTRRGRAYEIDHRYELAVQNYAEMRAAAARLGDRPMDLAGLLATATLHSISESVADAAKAVELSNAGITLARELGDRAAESKALWNLMLVHLWLVEDPPRAIAYGERSLTIARELNLKEQVAYTTMDLGAAYFSVGQLDEAEEKRDAAGRLWTALGNQPMLAYNLGAYMVLLLMSSKYDKLFQVSDEIEKGMHAFTSRRDHGAARAVLSYVWMDRGEYTKALEVLEQGLRDFVEEQHAVLMDLGRATLFWYYATLGATEKGMNLYRMLRRPDAEVMPSSMETMIRVLYALFEIASGHLQTAETTLSYCQPARASPWAVWVQHAQSRLALAQGDYDRAVSLAGAAADRMRQMGMHQFLSDVLFVKGQAHAKLGERDTAKTALAEARAEAEAFGCRRMLWQILLALAALEDDPTRADALRTQARDVIDFIAAHTPAD